MFLLRGDRRDKVKDIYTKKNKMRTEDSIMDAIDQYSDTTLKINRCNS